MITRAVAVALLLASLALAGCSSAPRRPVPVSEVMSFAPAAVASGEPALQVCVIPARRYLGITHAPDDKTLLAVPLTRADGASPPRQVGSLPLPPTYAGPLGYPVTFTTRSPFALTLQDGILRVSATEKDGKTVLTGTVEGAKAAAPPGVSALDEVWIWIGPEPTRESPDRRGTFVGVRVAR